jgi:hypothetical protein
MQEMIVWQVTMMVGRSGGQTGVSGRHPEDACYDGETARAGMVVMQNLGIDYPKS